MIHPLLRLVATQPHLLADHAEAYAGLVGAEISRTASGWKQRILLLVVALSLVGLAVIFAGVSLMLWATLPTEGMKAPWALIAVPLVPALVGIGCVLIGQQKPVDSFAELKQQIAEDLALLREVSAR